MENGTVKILDSNLWRGTDRRFQINKLMSHLGIHAHENFTKELNKIIVKSLSPKAMYKYVGEGGDDVEEKAENFELMLLIKNKMKLKRKRLH